MGKWSGAASVKSQDYRSVQINIEGMIARATRASLNLTVRVFKCSSVWPFPFHPLSLFFSFSLHRSL